MEGRRCGRLWSKAHIAVSYALGSITLRLIEKRHPYAENDELFSRIIICAWHSFLD